MPPVNPLVILLSFRKQLPFGAHHFLGCVTLITLLTNYNQALPSTVDQKAYPETRMEKAKTLRSEWHESSLRKAILEYAEVQRQSKATGDYELAAQAAKNGGDVYFLLGDYRNALKQYEEAQSLWRLARNRSAEMQALNLVGYVHVYLGKSETGLKLASRVLTYFRSGRNDPALAEAENCAGEAHSSLGRLRKSIEHFERALALWTASNDKSGQALAILNIAYSYSDSGDIQKAQNLFTQSLSIYKELGNKRGEARALTGLGSIHSFLGEKQAALDKHLQAMNLLRTIGDHAGEAIALNNIGQAYEDLNNLPTALDNYKQALKLNQELGNVEYESATRYYIARTYNSLGDKQTALKFYTESANLSKQIGQRRVTAYALSAISAIKSIAGQRTEAVAQLQQAVRLYRDIGDRRGQAVALSELGNIHRAMGHNGKALACHKRARELYHAAGDRNREAAALYDMAITERALSDFKNALNHVKESNEVIEILRSQIVSPDLRASYYASVHKHAELYIDLLMRLGSLHDDKQAQANAFEISEHTHSRALLEILGEAAAGIKQGVNPVLLEQERVLQQRLNAKALYQMRLLANSAEPGELETVARDLRELTTSYRELQTQIKQQSPRYANLVQPQPLKLEHIQAELTDDTILLQYSLGTERSYLWAVTKDSLTAYELPARDVVENLVKSVCESLVARQTVDDSDLNAYSNQIAGADLQYWRRAAHLSEMLLGPVVDRIKWKTILVVPDGALHYLPFEALPELGERESVPLIIGHEIVNLPSASILATIRQNLRVDSPQDKLIAILADPVFSPSDPRVNGANSVSLQQDSLLRGKGVLTRLPATKQEAEAIMAIVPAGTSMMATGFDADRTVALSAELGKYKVLHLATHGMVDVENPEMSGIMFSLVNQEGKTKEGFVQLHDIYNLNLSNTRLVVLSACETGLGKNVRGEGLVGFSRGFIYAGASTVIASLWKVDDSATSQLMTQFYKGMFEDRLTPSAALRNAKVNMWRQPRYRAPFYWAAFVLQGEYQEKVAVPPAAKFPLRKGMFAFLVLMAVGVLILLVMRHRARSA
jgi:CHAT domain-containing protein